MFGAIGASKSEIWQGGKLCEEDCFHRERILASERERGEMPDKAYHSPQHKPYEGRIWNTGAVIAAVGTAIGVGLILLSCIGVIWALVRILQTTQI